MAINTDVTIKAEFFRRSMPVKNMKEALDELEDEDILESSRVGNLVVMRPRTKSMVGYIDIVQEKFVRVEHAT